MLRIGNRNPFNELLLLIHEFRRGNDELMPLADAIRWQPRNDPHTLRRFNEWRRELRVVTGDPDAYTQIVMQALAARGESQSPHGDLENSGARDVMARHR